MNEAKFAEWKEAAQVHADDLGVVARDKLWEEDDPYDLEEAAKEAFTKGTDPKAFINEIFADELASAEHDEQQAAEALAEDEVNDDVE